MFDRKSDYALNKQDPEAIVCKSVTDIHIRLTRLDFASPEEFERWKRWSDENYHDTERQDHIYHNHILTLDDLTEVILAAVSPEEKVMDQQERQERERLYGMLREALETRLTDMQRRRLWMYYVEDLTIEEIAAEENVKHQNIYPPPSSDYAMLASSVMKLPRNNVISVPDTSAALPEPKPPQRS